MPGPATWQVMSGSSLLLSKSVVARSLPVSCPYFTRLPGEYQRLARGRCFADNSAPRNAGDHGVRKEISQRQRQIDDSGFNVYPRFARDANSISLHNFRRKYAHLQPGEIQEGQGGLEAPVEVHGRITSIRLAGKRLAFIDIVGGKTQRLQVMYNFGPLERKGIPRDQFTRVKQLMHRGDTISVTGHPHRTDKGELTIKAIELPKILSACLHDYPSEKNLQKDNSQTETEWQKFNKHVEMLINPDAIRVMIQRSEIIDSIRNYFKTRGFMEVQTPILAAAAGGATARPFETNATEFPEKKLALRVAPELWLKRLVIGGLPKVFEIGSCFRNEGLDKTHNPEFTSCEFYEAFATLPELITRTESLFLELSEKLQSAFQEIIKRSGNIAKSVSPDQELPYPPYKLNGPWPQVDFISGLNDALQTKLPSLANPSPETLSTLVQLFERNSIPLPENPTLPRLLDKLSSIYLEPKDDSPRWIINIPECMSPLSKSFIHPSAPNHQPVAARAELFIGGREVVNCYEEENNPLEQRRKFTMQSVYASTVAGSPSNATEIDPEVMKLDEDYLRALEWGLPPTGGWGCGIDRLVMLFTGKDRIGDVLSFGSLRAVARTADRSAQDSEADINNSDQLDAEIRAMGHRPPIKDTE